MDTLNEAFEQAMEIFKKDITETAFNLWIKDLRPISFEDSTISLKVRTRFIADIVNEKYKAQMEEAFKQVFGFAVNISFAVDSIPTPQAGSSATGSQEYSNSFGGDYAYTFENFIVGPSNSFAHAACLAVANMPYAMSESSDNVRAKDPTKNFNPLFIYGDSGLGKTHLVCAICEALREQKQDLNIVYVTGEQFTNDLIQAISRKNTADFHDKYRAADLLAVDDIQFIGGKESTQEEFFHTFNAVFQAGKQIVLTSDRPPKEIRTLEDRLRNRFESGLMADIQPPTLETRIAILIRKGMLMNFEIPQEVAHYIATKLKTNIRQLEGVVKKMKAYQELTGTAPSIKLADGVIKDILSEQKPIPMIIDRVLDEVSRTYNVSVEEIRGTKRTGSVSMARQIAMYILRETTSMSTVDIGAEFGGRDHSTVVYASQRVTELMDTNEKVRGTITDIIKNIKST